MASAATIAPTTFLTVLTGNTGIATITPPVSNAHMLALQFAGTAGVLATGNIGIAVASVVGQVMLLVYNPATAKYSPVG
jgi:energy-converting hydrogenase Eha subunit C